MWTELGQGRTPVARKTKQGSIILALNAKFGILALNAKFGSPSEEWKVRNQLL